MSAEEIDITPESITPEQFAQLVAAAENDQQIVDAIHAAGTEVVLNRIFEGFEQRFVPEKAQGVEADIVFLIDDGGTEHPFTVSISNGTCNTKNEAATDPKTTLKTDLVSFVKLITGVAEGVQLFMGGKLRITGDLMFAQRLMTFFDAPRSG